MANVVVQAIGSGGKTYSHRRVLSRANAGAISMVELEPAEMKCVFCTAGICTKDEVKKQFKESAYVSPVEGGARR